MTKPRLDFAGSAVERMVMLQPDLVVGMVGMVKPLTIEILDRLQVPLLLLEAKTLGDIYRHIRWIGQATSRLVDADRVITHMEARREALKVRLAGVDPIPVFYVINDDPLVTIGPNTFIHEVLAQAGGRNIVAAATGAYPRFSVEEVLMSRPEAILFASGEVTQISTRQRRYWQRWPSIPAVANEQLLPVNSDLVSRPGPRIYDAAWELAMLLHPDQFSSTPLTDEAP